MPHPDTIRFILVVISLICLLGVFIRPFWGLISYLLIMFIRPGLFYPTLAKLRVELVVGIIIILFMLFSSGRVKRIQFTTDPICKWLFFFFGVIVLSMIQAFHFQTAWERMYDFFKVLIFFLMIITLIDTEKDVNILLWTFIVLTALISYDALYNYKYGNIVQAIGDGRIDYATASKGMGSGHVALSNMILQGLPMIWYLGVINKNKSIKVTSIFFFLIGIYGVVISGSRGGFVGLIVLSICLIAFAKQRMPMVIGIAILFLIIPIFSTSGYFDYMKSILSIGSSDVSGSSRITGFRHGLEMLIKRPILGVGPGCYPVARKAWFGWGLWSHNHYGQLMGDLGILGVITWSGFLFAYLKETIFSIKTYNHIQEKKAIFVAIFVATIVRLVLGIGSHSLYIFFWYLLAGIVIAEKQFSEEESGM